MVQNIEPLLELEFWILC